VFMLSTALPASAAESTFGTGEVGEHEREGRGLRREAQDCATNPVRRITRSSARSICPCDPMGPGLLQLLVWQAVRADDRHRLLRAPEATSSHGAGRIILPRHFSCSVLIGSQSVPGGFSVSSRARWQNSDAGRSMSAERPKQVAASANWRVRQCASPPA